jgi:branched-chain amino acid transport system substrate-binding protein
MTSPPVASGPGAAELAANFPEALRNPFATYAAVQVWAQAVEMAGTFETEPVSDALRSGEFNTVLGRIGFDDKGDVTGYEPFVWHVWKDGKYAPVDIRKLAD